MGNVFRSKEVYTFHRNSVHGGKEIIPVRGVYVSGEYKPPYYNEPVIHLTSIGSIKGEIYTYTETRKTNTDPILRLVDIDIVPGIPNYQVYSTTYCTSKSDPILRLVDIDMDVVGVPNCVFYSTTYCTSKSDPILRLVDIDMTYMGLPAITQNSVNHDNSTPEPTLHLTGITSDEAVITDYIP